MGLLPIGAIFGLIAYTTNIEIKDLDLWLHIAMGRFIMLHHYVPDIDIFSNSIAGTPWVNHEWLFQILVYNIFNVWGPDGLLRMQTVIVTVTMLLLLFLGYNREKQLTTGFVLCLVYLVFQQRFTLRPDLYSLLFFVLYIYILALHIDKRWAAPFLLIIQIIWSNMHGFFFFGPLFVMIGLTAEWIKRHVKLPYKWNKSGRLDDDEYRRLRRIFIFVTLACLVNPLFLKGALYPISIFFSISGDSNVFFKYIQELQPPITWESLLNINRFLYFKVLIFLSFASFVFNRRNIDISALFFWVVFLLFSLKAVRNCTFFAFAAYLVIVTNMISVRYGDIVPLQFTRKKFEHLTIIIGKILFLLWIVQYATSVSGKSYYDFDKYELKSEFGGVSQRTYPNKAVDFLISNHITGNFFNDFNSGAYLLGRTYPDIRVFIDGRTEVYGSEFFIRYKKMWDQGDKDLLEEVILKFNLTGALLNSTRQHIPAKVLKYFYNHEDWTMVYFDYDGVIFLRDISDNQENINKWKINLEDWKARAHDILQMGDINVRPYQNYYRAYTLESLDFDKAALAELLAALKVNPTYAGAYELQGKIYTKNKEFEKAFESFRSSLMIYSGKKEVRLNLARTYYDLQKYDAAIEQFEKILKVWPKYPKAYFFLAKSYVYKNRYADSLEILTQAHKLIPEDVYDILNVADLMYEQGEYETAEQSYMLALQTGKKELDIRTKLAKVYEANGQRKRAIKELEKILQLDPENQDAPKYLKKLQIAE